MVEIAKAPKKEMIGGVEKWEAESAADVILRAEEIKYQPKLLNAAKIVLHTRFEALKKIQNRLGKSK